MDKNQNLRNKGSRIPIWFNSEIGNGAMHARKAFGIIPNENGRYVMVSLWGESKQSRIAIRRWNIGDKLQSLRLLHRGVHCGIPSFWKSAASHTATDILSADSPDSAFTPWADRMTASFHIESLSDNLLALVPEDVYLSTVPLFCGDAALHSFISVHILAGDHDRLAYLKIGIIINTTLIAVYALAPGNETALESHLARIQRYFARAFPRIAFPNYVYMFDGGHAFSSDHFIFHSLEVKIGNRTVREADELRALGCALAQRMGGAPVFSGPACGGAIRRFRAAAWTASAALVLITALAICAPAIMNFFLGKKIQIYELRSRSVIMSDPRIKAAITRNQTLGTSIIRLSAKAGDQTQWGFFLQSLGALRPEGLYFEKLGSEAAGASFNAVRIAIAGSAQNETMVTDLISQLQKTGIISNISLTSMEKNKDKPTICDFKIICTLKVLK